MGNNAVSPYQQVIEKTKSLSFRSQMLAMNIEKRVAHSNRNEVNRPGGVLWRLQNSWNPSEDAQRPLYELCCSPALKAAPNTPRLCSMDLLMFWAVTDPAVARLLWVLLLVVATFLIWLFFCCYSWNQSSSPSLERYLAGRWAQKLSAPIRGTGGLSSACGW
ncbi:hypothetical protein GOODEAATRI_029675 [Goodea atripinnis]|uniref:Uncharacterized protein n=1 Tax=Goodea atripinnis TaxID=208336 RepID=A0ABV0PT53_9TELE